MAVQKSARAPYASTGSIKTVIEKHRQVGLQTMSLQRLQQIGVTEALAPRTLQALNFLGFYDENGNVTPEFDALRKVAEHDFKPRLAELLRRAYAPILEILNPATATPLDVENAFRGFEPTGQLSRMIQLFMGLMIFVDLMPEDQRRRVPVSGTSKTGTGKGSSARGGRGNMDADSGISAGRERQREQPSPPANGSAGTSPGERRDISFGDAGSVTVIVNVRWLDLPEDKFTNLRKIISELEALEAAAEKN